MKPPDMETLLADMIGLLCVVIITFAAPFIMYALMP